MKLCFLVCSTTGFSITSKLSGLLTKIPKINSVDSNSDSLENTSRAYSKNLGMGAIFQKKGKEMLKNGKIFKNLGKNVQNLKIFRKRAGDCMR